MLTHENIDTSSKGNDAVPYLLLYPQGLEYGT